MYYSNLLLYIHIGNQKIFKKKLNMKLVVKKLN